LGILVPTKITHGIWSDVGRASGLSIVLGYLNVQAGEVKNQSIYSRSGSDCILLHVNNLPLIASSTKPM
jgi:hypothetical protein